MVIFFMKNSYLKVEIIAQHEYEYTDLHVYKKKMSEH